ncbi:hypothetical protein HDU91_004876 [Kappamyces sp. JEL0680]|nr:hypothetical protein HDU91_004876 [Kappamyces sp. JEL0680]
MYPTLWKLRCKAASRECIRVCQAPLTLVGYGFLSESSQLVHALTEANIAFIGPNVRAMEAMGDKIQSKLHAEAASVKYIPGYNGVIQSADHAVSIARSIGYPVMIKASAGGGGKGMRVAFNDDELVSSFRLATGEARSSFGDSRLLVEKFISSSRHIEVQILGDKHGNIVYFPERECSIQRRNQKVVEESPSSFVDPSMRQAMGLQAASMAKSVGYDSAGTCEFLVDGTTRQFYFLEMNTRLQVEHPITEMVSGVDIVEKMIEVASGKELGLSQQDISLTGWSFESRIYAEHPGTFMPSVGLLSTYQEPGAAPDVRCDSGVEQGQEVSVYYDPLLCKLITHAPTRAASIAKMKDALDHFVIQGVVHNIPLLRDIYEDDDFVAGRIDTDFLKKKYTEDFRGRVLSSPDRRQLLAAASFVHLKTQQWKSGSQPPCSDTLYISVDGGAATKLVCSMPDADRIQVVFGGETEALEAVFTDYRVHSTLIRMESQPHVSRVLQHCNVTPTGFSLVYQGTTYNLTIQTPRQHRLARLLPATSATTKPGFSYRVQAPMPGIVQSLVASLGQVVQKGDELCVIEAMKMQNVLRSPIDGVIERVYISSGDRVQAGQVLVEFSHNPLLAS